MHVTHDRRDMTYWIVRVGVVALTLATAYIHLTLGGTMFVANAAVYLLFAALMSLPIAFLSRSRWLIRAALILFALATVAGWVLFGARFWLGYLDKGIEIALIALLVLEMFRYDSGPVAVVRRAWHLGVAALHRLSGRSAT